MKISQYLPLWCPDSLESRRPEPQYTLDFQFNVGDKEICIGFLGRGITLFVNTDRHGGYGDIRIYVEKGVCVHKTSIEALFQTAG